MTAHKFAGLAPGAALAILTLALLGSSPRMALTEPLAVPPPTFATPTLLDPCVAGILGDVTDDATPSANVIDAQQIARASAGLPVNATVAGRLASHGDVTGDGNTNVIDAQQVARYSVGLTVLFPIGQPMCGIEVTTVTTGANQDPDGYSLTLDGAANGAIGLNQTRELTQLAVGTYQLAILGLAANCSVINGTASRSVAVTAGATASTTFEVQCTTNSVTLRVQNTTSGTNLPGSAYSVTVTGPVNTAGNMAVNGSVDFSAMPPGSYDVTIGNVPGNCTVSGGSLTKQVNVTGTESLVQVGFGITCS